MEKENVLHKKFGLWTAVGMVVGTVIGSGVFFKAKNVLISNNGDMLGSLLTVAIVGMIMLVCSYCFSLLAARVEKVNGLVDYSEISLGKFYAYMVGWFITFIFYPTITSCLAWISAQYTLALFGITEYHWALHLGIAFFYLVSSFLINIFSPKISSKFQVSTTFIKLVPLTVMAIAGTVVGISSGTFSENISSGALTSVIGSTDGGFFGAVVSFAFAYEGWIFATSINAELQDAKKTLPKALFFGAIVIILAYLGYFVGIFGTMPTSDIIASENLPKDAFSSLFGNEIFGSLAYVFVVISCLGTTNGLVLACCRGIYSVAVRGEGVFPKYFSHVNEKLDMPVRSSVFGFATVSIWLLQWQFGFINGWLPEFVSFENDELPIITFYACCIPIFIYIMRKCNELNTIKRFVIPSLAVLSCLFMVFSAVYKYRMDALYYFIVFVIVMSFGLLFYRKNNKTVFEIIISKIKSLIGNKKEKNK